METAGGETAKSAKEELATLAKPLVIPLLKKMMDFDMQTLESCSDEELIARSEELQQLYISQAIKKYCDGEYQYAGVNDYAAKISITITLINQEGVQQYVNTIWKLKGKGEIELITPYSGHSY